MPETLPPPDDMGMSDSERAQQLYWEISLRHPFSRFLQGAELALECHRHGFIPKKLQQKLLADTEGMENFLSSINQEHVRNGIDTISSVSLERGIRLVFGGWAQRMMLLAPEELVTVIETGGSLERDRIRMQEYMKSMDVQLNRRESALKSIPRPRRRTT